MELNEKQLDSVLAGYPKNGINEEKEIKELYKKEEVEQILKEEVIDYGELTEEQLDNITAGHRR